MTILTGIKINLGIYSFKYSIVCTWDCSENNPCRRGARPSPRVTKIEYEKLTDALPRLLQNLIYAHKFKPYPPRSGRSENTRLASQIVCRTS
jgi:hypothetical protein